MIAIDVIATGGAMRWFVRKEPKDIWDEPIQGPIGDIEAAERIRNICQAARALPGKRSVREDDKISAEKPRERERYERAARAAMQIAMNISDELVRDDAVRRIVELCMQADDIKTAQILYRAIHAPWIRKALQDEYPALGT